MRVRVIRPAELGATEAERWRATPTSSPFFQLDFTLAVASERDDLFIAIVDDESFFPFHRDHVAAGKPVGLRICDYHGIIGAISERWTAAALLDGCSLERWDFRAVPLSQKLFQPHHSTTMKSPIIDLADGFEAYSRWLHEKGSHLEKRIRAMHRHIADDLGPIEFQWHSSDPDDLTRLVECKSEHYTRTGATNALEPRWVQNVLGRLHKAQESSCRGVLSILRAGGHLLAGHFGIRSERVLHYWFPCYWRAFARYSPGLVLLFELARSAEAHGVSSIDLGFGTGQYKDRFANSAATVARGSVTCCRSAAAS